MVIAFYAAPSFSSWIQFCISSEKGLAKFTANASQYSSEDKKLILIYSNLITGPSVVYGVSMDIKHFMKTLKHCSSY